MSDEWYSRECSFCDYEAALACKDFHCRAAGYGEPHIAACPTITSRQIEDCTCVPANS